MVTKVWYTHLGYGRTKLAVEDMLAGLNGCCEVTMLIHWPRCRDDISWMHCAEEEANLPQRVKDAGPAPAEDAWKGSWTALEEFYAAGRLKNIGVSNFELDDLNELLSSCKTCLKFTRATRGSSGSGPRCCKRLSEERVLYQAYNVVNGIVMRESAAPRAYRVLADVARAKECRRRHGRPGGSETQGRRDDSPRVVTAAFGGERAASRRCGRSRRRRADTIDAAMKALMSGRDLPPEQPVVATFTSSLDAAVRLFWKNPDTGEEVLNGEVSTGDGLRIHTHPGHTFIAPTAATSRRAELHPLQRSKVGDELNAAGRS